MFASETLIDVCWSKAWVDRNALVEHEAGTVVVFLLALFEVLKNSPVELIDLIKAEPFHVGSDFFASDPAGAEHDDGLFFDFVGQGGCGGGELAKVFKVQIDRVVKGA
jgi:hypothetical protein